MTAHPDTRPVIDFDPHGPEYTLDSRAQLAALREATPIAYSRAYGGFWLLTRYEDVCAAARDPEVFSSRHDLTAPADGVHCQGVIIPPVPYWNAVLEDDPPAWNEYRRALQPLFAPAAIAALRPQIERFTTECIDEQIESGHIDFVRDLANPVPAMTALAIVGVSTDATRVASICHEAAYVPAGTEEHGRVLEGFMWLSEQLQATVEERRRQPREDLVSSLVEADVNGRRLDDEEIVSILNTVLHGGSDTLTALMAHTLLYLDAHHDERRRLAEDHSLIAVACEEFLRTVSPNQGFARTVTRDVEFNGQQLLAGDRIFLSWAAANLDPAEFDEPTEVRLDRPTNRHVAFGAGPHRCIGAGAARLEFEVMLEQVLTRLPDYEIDVDAVRAYPSRGVLNGFINMPASFSPELWAGADDSR